MSRTDDVINVAGHRLSTGAMEEVLAAHPDIAEPYTVPPTIDDSAILDEITADLAAIGYPRAREARRPGRWPKASPQMNADRRRYNKTCHG